MPAHPVVSTEDWIVARKALLQDEKEFTQQRDDLSRKIRALPWRRVENDHVFDGPNGEESLADLFDGRSQLLIYHFMFGPDWEEGCRACSLCADHFDPLIVHLNQRDVSMVVVSNGPLANLQAFQERMGWKFKWVSSMGTDFNFDFRVSFTAEQVEQGHVDYNYSQETAFPMEELPGLSVFAQDTDGTLFHTYSTYARGLDTFLGVYRFLDIVPQGRDEEGLPHGMAWVRHRDRYGVDDSA